jgi:hypothetical protein
MTRVLVTGSRDWDDAPVIAAALAVVAGEVGPFTLVHGGARGADLIAAEIHTSWGGEAEAHPADWKRYGKPAGFRRNAEMVASGVDLCIAFIRAESRGATMCADLAENAGIETRRWTA